MIFLFDFTNWQSFVYQALPNFIPEYLLIFGVVTLVLWVPFKKFYNFLPWFSIALLIIEALYVQGSHQTYFKGSIVHTSFYEKITLIGILGSITTILFSQITIQKVLSPEYFIYVLTGQLGLQILGLSHNGILSFIAFELVSIVGYLLVLTFKENKKSAASGLKYFIYGAFSSGLMLYGLSLYYGIYGNVTFGNEWKLSGIDKLSMGFILAGIFFKLSIFPFHFWTPEVYNGAPPAVGAWLSTVSKLAGIAIFYAFFKSSIPLEIQNILWFIAIITMFIGNLGILKQNNVYRLMGYSSIAHSGFILMGLSVHQPLAQATVLFYILFSIPITFLTFYSIYYFSNITLKEDFTFWNGLGKIYSGLAFFLLIGIAGLIGLPPTVGFIAKLNLIFPVWNEYEVTQNPMALFVLIAFVVNTLLAFAAYSRIAILLFLRTPSQEYELNIYPLGFPMVLSVGILLFGIYGFDKILNILL